MKAKIISVKERPSHRGGMVWWIFMRGKDGHSYHTYTSPFYRNWQRWRPIVLDAMDGKEIWLTGLSVRSGCLIDGDSMFYKVA